MATRSEIERLRERCLDKAVAAGGDPGDIVNNARSFEAYVTDPRATVSPDVEELIAAARAVLAAEEGGHARLIAALQALGEPIR